MTTLAKSLPYGIPTLNLTRAQVEDPKTLLRALQNYATDITAYLQRISASINLEHRGAFGSTEQFDYFTPAGGGTVTATGLAVMILEPAADIASLTINLPTGTSDGQNFRVSSTKNITAVTLTPAAGQSTKVTKISLGANAGAQNFVFRKSNSTWYAA